MPGIMADFDDLAMLAKQNPQEFEALRTKLCNQLIDSAPEPQRRRLRGLQFQVDMERRKAATPMAACIRISEMMHASFDELRDVLNEATGTQNNTPINRSAVRTKTNESKNARRVINFPDR
jgi:hypothetical protein